MCLSSPTSEFAVGSRSFTFGPPRVMGIVNVTPDSFSGDGVGGDRAKAIRTGENMIAAGADLVDVGGESTRPGAESVDADDEISRTVEIVRALAEKFPGQISIDTMKAEVAEEALTAGATVVNDVNGLRCEAMAEVIAEHDASVIIMHMLGNPRTMQKAPEYSDVIVDISEFLSRQISVAEEAGIRPNRIAVDPGIGFGKTADHNIEILARLKELRSLGKAIVIGVSRKSFIGSITGEPVGRRLGGSIAAAILATMNGANIVRVHDVPETVQALKVAWEVKFQTTTPEKPSGPVAI